jgi:HK97 family phage major capsid protein
MVDINRSSTNVVLPQNVASEILSKVAEASVIQQASVQVTLPGTGQKYQTLTGEPTASWVGETDKKPIGRGTFGTKTMTPYKLAVIEPFSNEFRRDLPALYNELVARLPLALAKTFDMTVMSGTAPGSGFDTLTGAGAISLGSGVYDGIVEGITSVGTAGFDANGIIIAPQGEALLYGEKDLQDRPLFINNVVTDSSIGSILGRPVFKSRHAFADGGEGADTLGYIGDWTRARWGTVEGVQIRISSEATLTDGEGTINLFEQNMFAVLAEIEVGFIVQDLAAFNKLTA